MPKTREFYHYFGKHMLFPMHFGSKKFEDALLLFWQQHAATVGPEIVRF